LTLYLALKWLHVLGAMLIFGTGLGTAFHFWLAHRTGDAALVAAAARSTVIADFAFTLPAVILQPLTGFALAHTAGYPLDAPWIVASFSSPAPAGFPSWYCNGACATSRSAVPGTAVRWDRTTASSPAPGSSSAGRHSARW
jgi:hypothetical protein